MTSLGLLAVVLLLLANGFFVAAEFALVKVRLSQIEDLAKKGSWAAKITESVLERLDAYLSACQLGITLASLGLGWVGEPVVARLLEPIVIACGFSAERAHYIAFPVAFVSISSLHIILGELAPKSLAIRAARPTSLICAPPLMLFYRVFLPFIYVLNNAANLFLMLCGVHPLKEGMETHTADELRLILAESAAGGELSRRERLMMENVLDLEDKVVRQVMVPRRDIVYLNTRKSVVENLALVSESRHTRFPLCDGELDRVVGMVHTKDVLISQMSGEPITSFGRMARRIPFLAETMRLDVVLREFQKTRTHVAMVVDEFGSISGMITFENVLEEIIGPIQDEFDRELPQIIKRSAGRYHIDGLCPVADLADELGLTPPEDLEAETTGGMVIELLGHIPNSGEKVKVGRFEFRVLDAEPTRVRRVEAVELEPMPESARQEANSRALDSAEFNQIPHTGHAGDA
jgi:CBS domain containing-hemolysin-like protein